MEGIQSPQLQEQSQVIPGPPHGLTLDLWLLYLLEQVLPILAHARKQVQHLAQSSVRL